MLEVLNRYGHGFVVTPAVLACRLRGLWENAASEPCSLEELTSRCGANSGHLRVVLRQLESLGGVSRNSAGLFKLEELGEFPGSISGDILRFYEVPPADLLVPAGSQDLAFWVDRILARWDTTASWAGLFDGCILVPLLLALVPRLTPAGSLDVTGLSPATLVALGRLFAAKGWGSADGLQLNPAGRFLLERAPILATIFSYGTMLARADELLFGNPQSVFSRNAEGHETHVDRHLNVTGSGFQHERFFAQLDEIIIDIFSRGPFETQPRYVADMGCGDGTLLLRIYRLVEQQTPRGKVLRDFPLCLVGLDYNQRALEETARTLRGVPHLLLRADIGKPQDIAAELGQLDIDSADVLHVRSFLDHDRPFLMPDLAERTRHRERISSDSVSVDESGGLIPSGLVVESLVRHLESWSALVNRHGLVLLEVHCLAPSMVKRFTDESESLHFDAYHGFSRQHLVEAHVFRLALAEAGLFPRSGFSRRFPQSFPFTRITLDWLEKREYRVRHATPDDLSSLLRLEDECWAPSLRVPAGELLARMDRFPEGQFVLEAGGRVAAVLYSQRISSVEVLERVKFSDLPGLHASHGSALQLLGLNVAPEMSGQSLGAQLADVVFDWCRLRGDIEAVAGLTRCREYVAARGPYEDWVRRSEDGVPADPILKFHLGRGAQIRTIVPGYRPEDTDNLGHGVLITYSLQDEQFQENQQLQEKQKLGAQITRAEAEAAVATCVRRFLRSSAGQGYSATAPLREMGLDSLDLMELRVTLGRQFQVHLDASFFFEYSTPWAIAGYLSGGNTGLEVLPAPELPGAVENNGFGAEAIAIVGMGCRFPGGVDTPEAYWNLLMDGATATGPVPASRWNPANVAGPGAGFGGFLADVDQFDAAFFRIAPREANFLDPQQRLLLEESWRALENAGIDPGSLAGSRTGVFTGIFSHDYEMLSLQHGAAGMAQPYLATGNAAAVASGRLAYFLDLRGPAITLDTACSSSLVAVHLAGQSLRSGECTLALAGGVNLILTPNLSATFGESGMLAPDGRCKTFDASADGYVRSEGCAVVVLKLLSKALADGDDVLAVIRGSAVNQDGASNGLTAPNAQAQEAVLRQALTAAGCQPAEISYVEAHGTGTALGDPVETKALGSVYGEGRSAGHPLLLGSVKTNIGHTEAAAGLAGLLKVVLAFRHRRLPKHPHFSRLNDGISLDRIPARIPVETEDWHPGFSGRRLAGVSSFGFSGTNAHVILEEAPPRQDASIAENLDGHILALSAGSQDGLRTTAQQYARFLESHPDTALGHICHTANAGRRHFEYRFAVTGSTRAGIVDTLRAFDSQATISSEGPPQVAFLYTGQGSQYASMGRDLYRSSPVFRAALDRCNALLPAAPGESLLELLYNSDGNRLSETRFTQPALFAIEYALTELWRSLGVSPAAVMGHSVGEFAAAVTAGILSLEDGLALITERARLMQEAPRGAMLAVLTGAAQVQAALRGLENEVEIAAYNGPSNIVIAGGESRIAELERRFKSDGIRAVRLNVSHAFHSPLMNPVLEPLTRAASGLVHRKPTISFISNRTGDFAYEISPTYWAGHARHAVRFAEGVQALVRAGYRTFLEIGPRPTLIDLGRSCAPDNVEITWLSSLYPGRNDWNPMLDSVRELYLRGANLHWQALATPGQARVSGLPGYPFERKRYWLPAAPQTQNAGTLLGDRLRSALSDEQFQATWDASRFAGHRVHGHILTPAAAYLTAALQASALQTGGTATQIADFEIEQPLVFPDAASTLVQTTVGDTQRLSIHSFEEAGQQWKRLAVARIVPAQAALCPDTLAAVRERLASLAARREPAGFYKECAAAGLVYGTGYRGLQDLFLGEQEALGKIEGCEDGVAALDAALQVALAALPDGFSKGIPLPVEAKQVQAEFPLPPVFWSHASLSIDEPRRQITAKIILFSDRGAIIGAIEGLTLRFREDHAQSLWKDWLCRIEWQAQPLSTPPATGDYAAAAMAVNALAMRVLDHQLAVVNGESVQPHYRQLFFRLLRLRAHAGPLPPVTDLGRLFRETRTRYPEAEAELILLERCGAKLGAVLSGRCDPLDLLFPQGDVADCRRLYSDSPAFAAMNTILQQTVTTLAAEVPGGRRVRILEIGGGTGAATAAILPHLDPQATDYTFTDVSGLFAALAAERFQQYPFLTCRSLDIEKECVSQGFETHSFDLIVASNVLHATADLSVSLRHARQLLAPGGALVLLEVTEPQLWIDLVFGLTEGWWRFEDRETRADYPLLSSRQWRATLEREGFAEVSVQQPAKPAGVYGQAVLVAHTTAVAQRKWLLFGDAAVPAMELRTLIGSACAWIAPGQNARQAVELACEEGALAGVIYLRQSGWQELLDVVQTLVEVPRDRMPRLWVVTTNAVAVQTGDSVAGISESPLWGLGRVVAREHAELRCHLADIDGSPESLAALWSECQQAASSPEEIGLRGEKRFVARLSRWNAEDESMLELPPVTKRRRAPQRGEVEIRIAATGLNFRDVLSAAGQYPGGPVPLGVECSGTVERVGPGVVELIPGQEVLAIGLGCFADFVITPAEMVVPKPGSLSFAEAAGVAVPFLTAAYGLEVLAQLKKGDRVLIHAAAGGVGFAACQIARRIGAEIHATASRTKWEFLRQHGIEHIYDSRTEEFVSQVMTATNGHGVDVILNSLAGEAARKSYDLLRPAGIFVELAKNSPVLHKPGCRAFDLLEVAAREPVQVRNLLQNILADIENGRLQPLPLTIYPQDQQNRAFQTMQQGRHIGKIVVAAKRVDADGTYVITGGTGGLGVAVSSWLVEQGARRLLLISRRGPDVEAEQTAALLHARGAEVVFARADVGQREEVAAVLAQARDSGHRLRGIIHAAGVLDDGLLADQTASRFRTVLQPKADAAWHLHELTQQDRLEMFVLFSSVASVIGSPGQGNHAAANAFLDSLAAYRRARGLPALTINWGAWSNIGSAAGAQVGRQLRLKGLQSMTPAQGIAALQFLLDTQPVQAGVLPVDWNAFAERHGATPFFSSMRRKETTASAPTVRSLAAELRDTSIAQRPAKLRDALRELLCAVLGLPAGTTIADRRGFFELGLDSLGSVELRNKLQKRLDRVLPSSLLFDYPNLDALTAHLLQEMFMDAPVWSNVPASSPVLPVPTLSSRNVDALSEDEAERALLEQLEQIESA